MPRVGQEDPAIDTVIGKTMRPMSSKIPKPPKVNSQFKQQRKRLGSAKIRGTLKPRGEMF
jgi:hypothetical protein